MMEHSAKFQVSSIKDVAGVAGAKYESARAITSSKMAETKNQKPHAHLNMIRRQYIKFQISPMKDVRGVAGTGLGGRTDAHTDERGSFLYSLSAYVGKEIYEAMAGYQAVVCNAFVKRKIALRRALKDIISQTD